MKEKILANKWLFKQFTILNRTARSVYGAIQGGADLNFYSCAMEYESGVYGWIKENTAWNAAIEIYEQYTSNEVSDILNDFEEVFGDELKNIDPKEIAKWEIELSNE